MKLYHTSPCSECPWRKCAPEGWLGGHPPEMYADAVQEGEAVACHKKDFGPESDRTAFCAGALATMANQCIMPFKTPGSREAMLEVGKSKNTFGHAALFYKHHTGQDYVPRIMRSHKPKDQTP